MEQATLKAANGEDFSSEIDTLKDFCYKNDIEWSAVSRHLPLLKDVVVKAVPDVKVVTSIRTVCDAINSNNAIKCTCTLSSLHDYTNYICDFKKKFLSPPMSSHLPMIFYVQTETE